MRQSASAFQSPLISQGAICPLPLCRLHPRMPAFSRELCSAKWHARRGINTRKSASHSSEFRAFLTHSGSELKSPPVLHSPLTPLSLCLSHQLSHPTESHGVCFCLLFTLPSGSCFLTPGCPRGFLLHSRHNYLPSVPSKCCFHHCIPLAQIFNFSPVFSSRISLLHTKHLPNSDL